MRRILTVLALLAMALGASAPAAGHDAIKHKHCTVVHATLGTDEVLEEAEAFVPTDIGFVKVWIRCTPGGKDSPPGQDKDKDKD